MIRLLFTVTFCAICLSMLAATTYEVPPQVLYWLDGVPIYQIEDPKEFGADPIEFDPMDGSRTAYHWDGRKYVKMWRRG